MEEPTEAPTEVPTEALMDGLKELLNEDYVCRCAWGSQGVPPPPF